MRFPSRTVLAALPAVLAAAVLPSTSDPQGVHIHPRSTDGSTDGSTFVFLDPSYDQPNVVFSVPCTGCVDDDALLFNFRAFPSQEACGVANVTINGQSFDQIWNGTHGIGTGNLESLPYSSQRRFLFPHHLDLAFESSCLSSNASEPSDSSTPSSHTSTAQVFTVTIRSVDGQPVENLSGFTISFRPQIPLELLRLSAIPDLSATRQPLTSLWHNPPEDLRLPNSPEANLEEENTASPTLDDFEKELERIFAERHQNDELLKEAYKAAMEEDRREGYQAGSPANREFMRLMDEMQRLESVLIDATNSLIQEHSKDALVNPPGTMAPECHSVRCLIDKFFHDARAALEKFIMKIKPNFAPSQASGSHQVSLDTEPPYGDDPSDTPTSVGSARPAVTTRAATSVTASINTPSSNPYFRLGDGTSDTIDPFTLSLKIVGAITGLTCIFLIFRRSTCCCPQARADRRAQAEQRRTERQYRRAARTLQVQKWWCRWTGWRRDTQRIHDYEEKRALIRQQEGVLETVMQDEIRLLRAAHDAVNSIISASDRGSVVARTTPIPIMTQHRLPHQHQPHNYVPDVEAWQNVPLSRTNSLPDYRSEDGSSQFSSEPPAYSDDEGDIVTNGFRGYRGGDVSDDSDVEPLSPVVREQRRWSPGSSVISTSPRPSQETMRFLVR